MDLKKTVLSPRTLRIAYWLLLALSVAVAISTASGKIVGGGYPPG